MSVSDNVVRLGEDQPLWKAEQAGRDAARRYAYSDIAQLADPMAFLEVVDSVLAELRAEGGDAWQACRNAFTESAIPELDARMAIQDDAYARARVQMDRLSELIRTCQLDEALRLLNLLES